MRCRNCATTDSEGKIVFGRHETTIEARACKGILNPDAVRMMKWVLNELSKDTTPEMAFAIAAQTLAQIGEEKFVEQS